MSTPNRPNHAEDFVSKHSEIDVLMTRIIDREASEHDFQHFECAADAQPELWRELAMRHRDAVVLAQGVAPHLNRADRMEFPPESQPLQLPFIHQRHVGWLFASAGWAAAITLLLLWRLAAPSNFAQPANNIQMASQMTPDQQLRSYLQAPYVIGELDPVMEKVDELPDGRLAVVVLRRIQEVVFLDEDAVLPVDDERQFIQDPIELRSPRK